MKFQETILFPVFLLVGTFSFHRWIIENIHSMSLTYKKLCKLPFLITSAYLSFFLQYVYVFTDRCLIFTLSIKRRLNKKVLLYLYVNVTLTNQTLNSYRNVVYLSWRYPGGHSSRRASTKLSDGRTTALHISGVLVPHILLSSRFGL